MADNFLHLSEGKNKSVSGPVRFAPKVTGNLGPVAISAKPMWNLTFDLAFTLDAHIQFQVCSCF